MLEFKFGVNSLTGLLISRMMFQWSRDFLDLKYFIINHNSELNIKKLIQESKNVKKILQVVKKKLLKLVEELSKRIKTTAVERGLCGVRRQAFISHITLFSIFI